MLLLRIFTVGEATAPTISAYLTSEKNIDTRKNRANSRFLPFGGYFIIAVSSGPARAKELSKRNASVLLFGIGFAVYNAETINK
jgi:hypothetical protein